jgi:hypothetical protein
MSGNTRSNHKIQTVLPHPPQIPRLAPSDFHPFGVLNAVICGKRFGSDDKIIEEMKEWLQVQNLVWYKKGIDAFVSCWHKTGC